MRSMGHGRLKRAKTDGNIVVVPNNPEVSAIVEPWTLLFADDYRVRFNPFNGELWMSSYPRNEEVVRSPRQVIKEADRGKEKVVAKGWSRSSDIGAAIRRSQGIADRLEPDTGEAVLKTKQLMTALFAIIPQYRAGEITKEDLPEVQKEMGKVLVDSGYASAKKPNKQVAAEKAVNAVSQDPRGFVNSLTARTVAASAIKLLAADLIDAKFANEKYTRLTARLTIENDHERFIQGEAIQMMTALEDLPAGHKEFDQDVFALREFAKRFLSPEVIRVAPYRVPVIIARVNLFGFRDRDDEKFVKRVLEKDPELFERLRGQKNIIGLLTDAGDPAVRQEAIAQIKRRVIESREYIEIGMQIGAESLSGDYEGKELDSEIEKKEVPIRDTEIVETPSEKRGRQERERQWRWIDNPPKKD